MKVFQQFLLLAAIIFLFEVIPFLYNEEYSIQEMKWGWIVGMPIVWLIWHYVRKSKSDEENS